MAKHYKNEQIMKILTVLGAIVGLIYIINGFAGLAGAGFLPIIVNIQLLDTIINLIIGLVVVVLTFLVALKPNRPLPFHWLVLLILAILLVLFGAGIVACVLVLLAFLIGLIEDL
jgi:ABC-type polysaccharide/polyol phosphate export permease